MMRNRGLDLGARLTVWALPLLVAGCAWLEPDFKVPEVTPPAAFMGAERAPQLAFVSSSEIGSWQAAQLRVAEPRGNWWEIYGDAQLDVLMQDALANSPNLQVMAARVTQARARAGLAKSLLYPAIYGTGGVSREKLAAAQFQGGGAGTTSFKPQTIYTVGLNASYELDLFGRLTGQARQAIFQSLAQADLYESAKLALQADVVQAYFAARTSAVVMRDISETLSLAERNLALTKRQYELGDTSSQIYQQTVADLMNLRSDALTIEQQQFEAQNQLALLLGKLPGSVVISDTRALTELPPLIPAGVPASLLQRRPDVAAAQNQLAAANASIGVARAAFFPQLNLTGNAGYAAREVGDLFKSSTSTWAIGPALTVPIFQGATNFSNLKLSWAVYEEGVATYKQQVLTAFTDVENALSAHRITIEQASGQQQAAVELNKTLGMSERQYELGDISQLEVIRARQQTLATRINEQQAILGAYNASANLMRALGGGWQ